MKKMMIALVVMFVMSMSANAQSNENPSLTFGRMSSYLELRADQIEPVKTTMAQFASMVESINQVEEPAKKFEAWQKIQTRHLTAMQKILSERQFGKYEKMFETTVKNTAERMVNDAEANK